MSGKCSESKNGANKPKPLPPVATSCQSERMVSRRSTAFSLSGRLDRGPKLGPGEFTGEFELKSLQRSTSSPVSKAVRGHGQ
jgi:hypothetical protein